MLSLPTEIYESILDHVNTDDLHGLLLVSAGFHAAAERRLYHSIKFMPPGRAWTSQSIERKWKVFGRISECPRVAAYVRVVLIDVRWWRQYLASRWLPSALSSVNNLLHLDIIPTLDVVGALAAGGSLTVFQLHSFRCWKGLTFRGDRGDGATLAMMLSKFLARQAELRELETNVEGVKIQPTALRKLVTLRTLPRIAREILPTRRIRRLFLDEQGRVDPGLDGVLPGSESVTHFCGTLHALQCLAPGGLGRLRYFQLHARNESDYPNLAPYAVHCTALNSLRLLMAGSTVFWIDRSALVNVLRDFFTGCLTLTSIEVLPVYAISTQEGFTAQVWRRDGPVEAIGGRSLNDWKTI